MALKSMTNQPGKGPELDAEAATVAKEAAQAKAPEAETQPEEEPRALTELETQFLWAMQMAGLLIQKGKTPESRTLALRPGEYAETDVNFRAAEGAPVPQMWMIGKYRLTLQRLE